MTSKLTTIFFHLNTFSWKNFSKKSLEIIQIRLSFLKAVAYMMWGWLGSQPYIFKIFDSYHQLLINFMMNENHQIGSIKSQYFNRGRSAIT